ncbi:MAG TPA: hypothetical protein PLO50_07810, partial [Nitrospira sp.]|nr:hypothetical protein [Nitrospira sp.]
PRAVSPNSEDKFGCKEPPPDTFTSAGVDAHFAQSTFGKVVTGDVDIKTNPSVVSLASQAVMNARVRDNIRCLAINRDKFNTAQAIYLEDTNAFLETKPTPEDFMKWKQQNPFPAHSDEQIKVLEKELANQRMQLEKANQDLRGLQERVKDRRLTPLQFKTLVEALSKEEKGEIEIGFISGSSEGERFAKDLALALHLSGWTVTHMVSTTHIGDTPVGLLIWAKDPQMPRVRALVAALMQIDPRTQLRINPNLDRPVKFDVGNKP